MATTLHTFIDIFNADFEVAKDIVRLKKIVIPIIQRDYAQGRKDIVTGRVRSRFLDSLYKAIVDRPITLDFIYGDIDQEGVMTPLDGQQRLTTLFLLHWYAAKKCGVSSEEYEFLRCFSYETRYSSRDFCAYLVAFTPSFDGIISEEIINQVWFPLEWLKDATISAMLVMIDSINEKFKDIDDLWGKLKRNAISFYFLPIKDMGLTDELYIKMNSRGKPLTGFEHFKAEFERELKQVDDSLAKRVLRKVDIKWTDMLWTYRGENNIIDDEFLRYFRFICDIICYKNGESSVGNDQTEFDLLEKFFASDVENVEENISLMESYFDVWCDVGNPSIFLKQYISIQHEEGKIRIENKPDLFKDCLESYGDIYGRTNRRGFPLNRIVLLYAIIVYLENKSTILEKDFVHRLRIVYNLVRNSEDEISDSESRTAGNRMPAILRQVDSVIKNGVINTNETPNFNAYQLEEEAEKLNWLEEHYNFAETLFRTEDHNLLRGQIAILGLEHIDKFSSFEKLFDCDWDLIDCALLSLGDSKQCERNNWRYQVGSKSIDKAWISLFHKSRNKGFENTQRILNQLIGELNKFTDSELQEIVNTFVKKCESESEYPWRYYYVKYPVFRPGKYGKCSWSDIENGYYDMHTLWTESQWSKNSYCPFLQATAPEFVNKDEMGHFLLWKGMKVGCYNSGFIFYKNGTDQEVTRIDIQQNSDKIDTEDRILKLKEYIAANSTT